MTHNRTADHTPRTQPISDTERQIARQALSQLLLFLKGLWAAQQHSETLMDKLAKVPEVAPEKLFEIRHLLRKFQSEVRDHYARLIPVFSGAVQSLNALSKDTETGQMRDGLVDAVQQLSRMVESYMETFDDFGASDQIQRMKTLFQKIKQVSRSIENVIDGRLRDHFERNIIGGGRKVSWLTAGIRRRARLIEMLGV